MRISEVVNFKLVTFPDVPLLVLNTGVIVCNAETYMTYDELQKSVIRGYVLVLGIKSALEVELSSIIGDRQSVIEVVTKNAVVLEGFIIFGK